MLAELLLGKDAQGYEVTAEDPIFCQFSLFLTSILLELVSEMVSQASEIHTQPSVSQSLSLTHTHAYVC